MSQGGSSQTTSFAVAPSAVTDPNETFADGTSFDPRPLFVLRELTQARAPTLIVFPASFLTSTPLADPFSTVRSLDLSAAGAEVAAEVVAGGAVDAGSLEAWASAVSAGADAWGAAVPSAVPSFATVV